MLLIAALKRVFWVSSSSSRCFSSLFWCASCALRASRSVMSSCVTTQPPSALGWIEAETMRPSASLLDDMADVLAGRRAAAISRDDVVGLQPA